MKFTNTDVDQLKQILAACKVVGVDGIVINEGKARGAKPSLDAAVLTDTTLSIDPALKIGIGRVSELDKRISIFQGTVDIEGKSNDAGDVTMLTLSSGKTKVQFRCTSASLMRYPKSNDDQPVAMITFTKTEIAQAQKAVKTLGSENIVLQISRAGTASLECSDSANDRFTIELEKEVEFVEEAEGIVQTYLAGMFVDLIAEAAKDEVEVTIVLGEAGSITTTVKGQTLLIFSQIGDEED